MARISYFSSLLTVPVIVPVIIPSIDEGEQHNEHNDLAILSQELRDDMYMIYVSLSSLCRLHKSYIELDRSSSTFLVDGATICKYMYSRTVKLDNLIDHIYLSRRFTGRIMELYSYIDENIQLLYNKISIFRTYYNNHHSNWFEINLLTVESCFNESISDSITNYIKALCNALKSIIHYLHIELDERLISL
jgi:hypothetical protein